MQLPFRKKVSQAPQNCKAVTPWKYAVTALIFFSLSLSLISSQKSVHWAFQFHLSPQTSLAHHLFESQKGNVVTLFLKWSSIISFHVGISHNIFSSLSSQLGMASKYTYFWTVVLWGREGTSIFRTLLLHVPKLAAHAQPKHWIVGWLTCQVVLIVHMNVRMLLKKNKTFTLWRKTGSASPHSF